MAYIEHNRFEGESLETKTGWVREGSGSIPLQTAQAGLYGLGQDLIDAEERSGK